MSTPSRFVTSRAKLGSPIVLDTKGKRPVMVMLRDTEITEQKADAAAMRMADICAQALNRVDAEVSWAKKQKEGGK